MKIKYQKLNNYNYKTVLDIKHRLFPESNSDEDYVKYLKNENISNYYLIEFEDVPCATIG